MATPFPFVSGAVLTAAQLNAITELPVNAKTASYTLVASDAGDRIQMTSATATTITVNTGLFSAGQSVSVYNNGAGSCTITPGTATVTTTGALSIPTGGGGTLLFTSASAAIWLSNSFNIGWQTVVNETSVSAVSAINLDNIFTSTYQNYLVIANLQASGADNLLVRLRAGGTSTTTNYGYQQLIADGASLSTSRSTAQSSATIGALRTATRNSVPLYVYAPQIAQWTTMQTSFVDTISSTGFIRSDTNAVQTTTTQFDGLSIFCTTATVTGTYAVYGFNK
jgi:hypothetical protein